MEKNSGQKSPVTKDDWQKYHTAWQNYYQKYYSEYYAKAARIYVEKKMATEQALKEEPVQKKDPVQNFTDEFKRRIQEKASQEYAKKAKLKKFIPIFAGLSVALLILFLQYNRFIFAPLAAYVSPGNTDGGGITALDGTISTAVGEDSRLMIPKLNVDVPIAFGIPNDTASVNAAMDKGVAQFAIPGASAMPGETGNLVITGHSAGDIYSNNQYKFIFSGLERLVEGDLMYIDFNGVRYTYSAVKFEVVEPNNVQALVYETNKPMLTLITCTPLGTTRYRLLVTAEQISPVPDVESAQADLPEIETTEMMPKNEPTFFERIWNFFTGR